MNTTLKTIKKEKLEHIAILFMIVFIVADMKVPAPLAILFDSMIGRLLLSVGAISLLYVHTLVGVFALIFVYILIHRSYKQSDVYNLKKFVPSQAKKDRYLSAINQFPTTLEEEIVNSQVPLVKNGPLTSGNYKPISNDLHNAARITN